MGQGVIISTNNQVPQWTDQSTYNSNFVRTYSNPVYYASDPIMNNMPTIFFDGNNTTKILVLSTTTLSSITNCYGVTFCAVCYLNQRQDSTVGNTKLFKSPIAAGYNSMHVCIVNSAGSSTQVGTCNGCIIMYKNGAANSTNIGFNFTPNTPFILTITVSITSTYVTPIVYVNGQLNPYNVAPLSVSALWPYDLNNLSLSSNVLSECLCGAVSTLAFYNTVLTTTQRTQLEGYLAWKY